VGRRRGGAGPRLTDMQRKYLLRLQEHGTLGPEWPGSGKQIAEALVRKGLADWEDTDEEVLVHLRHFARAKGIACGVPNDAAVDVTTAPGNLVRPVTCPRCLEAIDKPAPVDPARSFLAHFAKTDGWIGCDLDGTLAVNDRPWPEIGEAVPAMLARVRAWVEAGVEVRIFTARAGEGPERVREVEAWLVRNGLPPLRVTDRKDSRMFQLWDDRAVRVEKDTGRILGPEPTEHRGMRRS